MTDRSYRFEVGAFECVAISDGSLNYPLESMFANVPREQVEAVLQEKGLPTAHVTTPYTILYVNTGQHRVMVDTGAGNLAANADKVFPSVDNSASVTGTLVENMREAEIEPADIDTVIITHAHPDHVGGTLDHQGNLVFANAQYYVPRAEWAFWTSDTAAAQASPMMAHVARNNLLALEGRVTLVDDALEIVPGIEVIETAGHTPGHIALSISSNGEQLLHIADVVLYPLHLEHPDWVPVFDMQPAQAAASKHRIFDQAAETKALLFAHHFPPFPNLGYVTRQGEGWQWSPWNGSYREE
ncbi:MAG: MBL fold metallo-hydrolase [Chloroflexota bacterium]|nr:MBL fold metallo-hydrolase [Chloroflexota bacterium]